MKTYCKLACKKIAIILIPWHDSNMSQQTEMLHCHVCQSSFIGEGEQALSEAWSSLKEHINENHPEVLEACLGAADNERACPNGAGRCPECNDNARYAGIPLSVILGKTKLTDHFSKEYIRSQTGERS